MVGINYNGLFKGCLAKCANLNGNISLDFWVERAMELDYSG
jgi:hypothetical protein